MQIMIFEQTIFCLKIHNFVCQKRGTEFLWRIFMREHQQKKRSLVSESLILKSHFSYLFQKHRKNYLLQILQFEFSSWAVENV